MDIVQIKQTVQTDLCSVECFYHIVLPERKSSCSQILCFLFMLAQHILTETAVLLDVTNKDFLEKIFLIEDRKKH